jgi:aspartate/tyrosine/aromatic aminotransferase
MKLVMRGIKIIVSNGMTVIPYLMTSSHLVQRWRADIYIRMQMGMRKKLDNVTQHLQKKKKKKKKKG